MDIESFNNTIINELCDDQITSEGIVFTPESISDFMLERIEKYIDISKAKLAGDPCFGGGVFINTLNKKYTSLKTLSFEKNKFIFSKTSNFLKSSKNKFLNLDTLFETTEYNGKFDLILGNPPYVRSQNISFDTKEKLENSEIYNKFLKGSYDLSVPFIKKTIDLLKTGGVGALILPRKIFSSNYGFEISNYLTKEIQILEFIDFSSVQLFKNKTTYTCIIIFKKVQSSNDTFLYSYTNINKTPIKQILLEVQKNFTEVKLSSLKSYPWKFTTKFQQDLLNIFVENGQKIQYIFNIKQGFRTGNNKAFIYQNTNEPNLKKYVDGRNIGKGRIKGYQYIVWPYKSSNNVISTITFNELRTLNPLIFRHISSQIHKKDSELWYTYARPQNLGIMNVPKIFVKEMMAEAEFAADREGNIAFSSGYALIPNYNMTADDLLKWSIILSTNIMEYQYRMISTPLHSGWFRMYKKHISEIILPKNNILNDIQFNNLLKKFISKKFSDYDWKKVNQIVAKYLNITNRQIEQIDSELAYFHYESKPSKKTKESDYTMNTKYPDKIEMTKYPDLDNYERKEYMPVELTHFNQFHIESPEFRRLVTYQIDKNKPIQRWYKYTQGYSVELVEKLLTKFKAKENNVVLDPFSGGGTTLLAAKQFGLNSIGYDVSPLSCWISKIKTFSWSLSNIENISKEISHLSPGFDYNFSDLQFKTFFEKAFHQEILAQTLFIKKWIQQTKLTEVEKNFLRLGLISIQEEISTLRKHGSHYRFLNESENIGVNKLNISLISENDSIFDIFKNKIFDMLNDITLLDEISNSSNIEIFCEDIRNAKIHCKVDFVITSPPYLNRNNYFSQQKIELSLLDLITEKEEYNELVKKSFVSHVEADLPKDLISEIPEVNKIITQVLKHESNNAKIPHMIVGYFKDMKTFLNKISKAIKPGGKIAIVVANSRWNGVVIPVDHLICLIAEEFNLSCKQILVTRMKGNSPQQMKKYGRIAVRESIIILEKI